MDVLHLSLPEVRRQLRHIMWQHVSLCRDQTGLLTAKKRIVALYQSIQYAYPIEHQKDSQETLNMLVAAQLVVAAALERRESRGSHWRLDYQSLDENLTCKHYTFYPTHIGSDAALEARKEVAAHA